MQWGKFHTVDNASIQLSILALIAPKPNIGDYQKFQIVNFLLLQTKILEMEYWVYNIIGLR